MQNLVYNGIVFKAGLINVNVFYRNLISIISLKLIRQLFTQVCVICS